MQHGEVRRRYLGIAAKSESLTLHLAAEVGQPKGVRVVEIGRDTPAASAGLRRDDLVLSVNGAPVSSIDDLQRLMALDPKPEVDLVVWRQGTRRDARILPFRRERAA